MQIDPSEHSRIFVTVTPIQDQIGLSGSRSASEKGDVSDAVEGVNQQFGRGVYTSDGLAFYGLLGNGFASDSSGGNNSSLPIPPINPIIRAQVRYSIDTA